MRYPPMNRIGGWRTMAVAGCVVVAVVIAGPARAGSEFEFPDNQDVSDTPGLFTGSDGGFVVTVWKDGRRTFGAENPRPAPYGAAREDAPQPPQPVYRRAPAKRRGVVSDRATPE